MDGSESPLKSVNERVRLHYSTWRAHSAIMTSDDDVKRESPLKARVADEYPGVSTVVVGSASGLSFQIVSDISVTKQEADSRSISGTQTTDRRIWVCSTGSVRINDIADSTKDVAHKRVVL